MKVFVNYVTILSSSLISFSIQASHCKYISAKYATKAFEDLARYKRSSNIPVVDQFCESCEDAYVKPIVIEELEYKTYQVKGFASISINGEEVDLAYLFLNGENLGHSYNCKTQVASQFLFAE